MKEKIVKVEFLIQIEDDTKTDSDIKKELKGAIWNGINGLGNAVEIPFDSDVIVEIK